MMQRRRRNRPTLFGPTADKDSAAATSNTGEKPTKKRKRKQQQICNCQRQMRKRQRQREAAQEEKVRPTLLAFINAVETIERSVHAATDNSTLTEGAWSKQPIARLGGDTATRGDYRALDQEIMLGSERLGAITPKGIEEEIGEDNGFKHHDTLMTVKNWMNLIGQASLKL